MMNPLKGNGEEEVNVFYERGPQSWQSCSTQWFAVPGTLHLAWAGIKPTTYSALSLLFISGAPERMLTHTHPSTHINSRSHLRRTLQTAFTP